MKTPREVLLRRHRSIEPKLDTIRQKIRNVRLGAESKVSEGHVPATSGRFAELLELLRPFRFNLAGLGLTCLVILAFRVATPETSNPVIAKSAAPSPDVLAALQEKRRLYAELIEQSPAPSAHSPKPTAPKPRSERLDGRACV
ncbi:MAG: hypothetical protein ABI651_22380 [Verrucomicrobiota bacterium]